MYTRLLDKGEYLLTYLDRINSKLECAKNGTFNKDLQQPRNNTSIM